ncbi:MAG: chemotaxis-specific protein-glutamate methyltransferase CheB [Anaerolineaceae bacterium]|nr:chemotaxis-specific protein-glutamate methyltransferase CheB [Anaerolineaceae bacterium]
MSERPPIRVLLADDSATTRSYLAGLIAAAPGLTVVGEARDGEEAVRMVEALQPDVVSMDIRMPRLDGLEATRQIMARRPTPTVVVSALIEEDVDLSFKAMEAGALAVLRKPPTQRDPDFSTLQREFITTLKAMAGVTVVRRWQDALAAEKALTENPAPKSDTIKKYRVTGALVSKPEIIAIGASAGGPSALSSLLAGLPANFVPPIVIVQHMPDEFLPGLARWLGKHTPLHVCMAESGQLLQPSTVYLAAGGSHLTIARRGRALITNKLENQGDSRYCPSIDVFFSSVAEVCGTTGVGIILTGMGDDGAKGLLNIRQASGRTFAQSEASCTVFGMPGVALAYGAVEQSMNPEQMAQALRKLTENS